MAERGDNYRTVKIRFLIEDSTPEHADEFVANLHGVLVESYVPSEHGRFEGEIVAVSEVKDEKE
jgi:hypothetical protein